jgi:hypothetical protein
MPMATPEEEALARQITETVASLLDGVLRDDKGAVAAHLAPEGLIGVGLTLFGMDALAVPLGLANRPHALGLTSVQASEGLAVAEVAGRDVNDRDTSICTIYLAQAGADWQVADIWPVPADYDLDIEGIAEPTVLFYTGQLQLTLAPDAELDDVEAVLVPALQRSGLGLHLIERGVHLWRLFKAAEAPPAAAPTVWAAALQFAVMAMDNQDPDPELVAAQYGVPPELVVERFMQLVTQMGFSPEGATSEQPQPPPAASGLVDLSGRPLSSDRPGENRHSRGGIILPGG